MSRGSKHELSRVRSAAGRAGAVARWGGKRDDRATAYLRCYPTDAEYIRALARERGQLPADVVSALLTRAQEK